MTEPMLLRRDEVVRLTGLSRPTIYRQIAAGNFPRPLRISAQSVGWLSTEIEEWAATRARTTPAASK